MKTVYNKNLEILNERRRLRSAATLLNYYIDNVDAWNAGKFTKDDLARKFNVTSRTVANWIYALVEAQVIKYKYSGATRLNPKIYYDGTRENYEKASSEYDAFRGDVQR
ncbi:MAG: replication/maintenance protein RepL [Clostridia bacterium]|nr:replication/maintenance protein RepL [Clostridia bacterium]